MNTIDYRLAPSGDGPLANTYADKPHRLVYDLANAVDNLQALVKQGADELERLWLGRDNLVEREDVIAALRAGEDELNTATSSKWQAYLDLETQAHNAKGSPLEQELRAKMEALCKARGWHIAVPQRGVPLKDLAPRVLGSRLWGEDVKPAGPGVLCDEVHVPAKAADVFHAMPTEQLVLLLDHAGIVPHHSRIGKINQLLTALS